LKIIEDSDYVQQFCTNVSQQNELIDANIMERVRTMARTVKSKDAYNLRGETHALGMLNFLNQNLANKGILVKRVMITSVTLDAEIADAMQETTIYQFKTTLERKRFAFNQRITNDREEEEKAKQIHLEERKDEEEQATLKQLDRTKDIE
jgi:regulator of protease activity HflC (stomatin/prohibitin superfamily)